MKHLILALSLLASITSFAQSDYYDPDSVPPAAENHEAHRPSRKVRRQQEKHGCYCPYQKSTSVWDDIWNAGIVGTSKAVYQSTVKPQVLGEVVGGVQGAAAKSPVPALVGTTAVAIGISEVQKSRRHQRNKQVPQAGAACNCDPCPYHGPRWGPAK